MYTKPFINRKDNIHFNGRSRPARSKKEIRQEVGIRAVAFPSVCVHFQPPAFCNRTISRQCLIIFVYNSEQQMHPVAFYCRLIARKNSQLLMIIIIRSVRLQCLFFFLSWKNNILKRFNCCSLTQFFFAYAQQFAIENVFVQWNRDNAKPRGITSKWFDPVRIC